MVERVEFERNRAFLAQRWRDDAETRQRAWRVAAACKWKSLHELSAVIGLREHRLAPSLDMAFRRAAPTWHLEKAELSRAFLDNFALGREHRVMCAEALARAFDALDENFDALVDWRDFVCHMLVLDKPAEPVRAKLTRLFAVWSDSEGKASLPGVWALVRSVALVHQRSVCAEAFVKRLQKVVSMGLSTWQDELDPEGLAGFLDRLSDVPARRVTGIKGGMLSKRLLESNQQALELPREARSAARIELDERAFLELMTGKDPQGGNDMLVAWSALSWDRLSDAARLRVRRNDEETSKEAFERVNLQIRWAEARAWFHKVVRPNVLSMRFAHWKQIATYRSNQKRGALYWEFRRKQGAFERLGLFAEARIFDRWRAQAAARFAVRVCKAKVLRRWKRFNQLAQRKNLIQVQNAKRLYESIQLETWLRTWRNAAGLFKRVRLFVKKRHVRVLREHVEGWREATDELLALKAEQEAAARERQQLIEAEILETEAQIQRMKEEKAEEERRERERLEAIAAEEAAVAQRWEEDRERAFESTERRRKLKAQEESRNKQKATVAHKQDHRFEEAFAEIEAKAIEAAKLEAETFLQTRAGREQMEVDVDAICNDSDRVQMGGKQAGNLADEGSDWKKMFDPVLETYFYFNRETGEKMPAALASRDEALKIARSNYIAAMVQAAKADVSELYKRENDERQQLRVAKMLQGAWRARKARRNLARMMYLAYVKRVDAYTGKAYYYNTQARTSAWTKPLLLGKEDFRTPEWVLRCDADGKWFHENRVSPWLTSPDKPDGYLPCLTCNLQLAWITCHTCSTHYCLDCFEEAHPLETKELRTHQTTRKSYEALVKASPEKCLMCKTETACELCMECGISDFYCARCYNMSHKPNPRRPARTSAKMRHGPSIHF